MPIRGWISPQSSELAAGQIGYPDEAGVWPEPGQGDRGGRTIAAPGQRGRELGPRGLDEQVPEVAYSATDDEAIGIERGGEVG